MDAARRERRHHRKAAAAAAGGLTGSGGGSGAAAAARAAYGDVFGGPPRFAAPFGGAPVDYAEVFGGLAATCSIPFLDLPPAAAVGDDISFFACGGGKDDYGEIFGRFDFADFAVPYEELFGAPEPEPLPEMEEIASSSSGSSRSSMKKESSHLEDEPHILQNLEHHQRFKEDKFSPMPFSPDTDSQQFVMSYNKTTERRPDDLVEMTTCTVESSMDFVIDSRNLSHGPAANHVSGIDNGAMANGDNERNQNSASVNVRSPESYFVVAQEKQSPSWPPISGSISANENHKNSDSHSTRSSGTPPDYAFLRVPDVDSQTQPIKLHSPLRQQPKLRNKKESAAKGDANLVNHSSTPTFSAHSTLSSNMPQADKKADAAPFNADANPTSASAAMKEAMDFAESRLKAAKELLERKGDSFKLRKKPSHRSTRSTEIKAPVPIEVDTSEQKLSLRMPSKDEKNAVESLLGKHKQLNEVRSYHFDNNGKRVLPLEKPQQTMQRCNESCQTSSKLEKLGNWNSGDEYYELTGDYQKCKTDKSTGEDEKHKQRNPRTILGNDKKSEAQMDAAESDLGRYEKLWEVNDDSRDVGVKHVNLRTVNATSVGKHKASVILEASTEGTAHQEIRNSNLEGLITLENAKENNDDEYVELPSTSDTSTKLDFIKDMSGLLSGACSSGDHASDLRGLGNGGPNVSPVAGTSHEHSDSKLVLEVPCNGEMPCTSKSSEQLQEPTEASHSNVLRGSNIKSLILEELEGSYVCDASPTGLDRVEQESETYGREKFSFTAESPLHNEDKEVQNEEKVGPYAYPEEPVVDQDAECSQEEGAVTLQNNNVADREKSNMVNVFEVASKLITRDLDQEMQGSLGHGEVETRIGEGTNGVISDNKGKEAEETSLEREKTGSKEGSAHGNQEDQQSFETTNRGQSDVDAKCDTVASEVGSDSFSDAASDSTTRTAINSKDETTFSSEIPTCKQYSMQEDESAISRTSIRIIPGLEEIGEVCNRGERELSTERSTCEEKKSRANRMEEKDTAARVSKAEHGPSPMENSRSRPTSAEGPTAVSAETSKNETLGIKRAKERENITRAESLSEEARESERRLEKERELSEERERRKLEEERERERQKDRLAVERATREAHERAFAEAREKAEKMAFERITAARQRASAEAREKEERASAEVSTRRATREARVKAERAAVERATAEARERAIEKAKTEKALADARERRERYRSSLKESSKSTNQDSRQETQFQKTTSSNFTRNPDSVNRAMVEVESALRHKARLERHQRTTERVTKALAEKNMRDLLAQREQAEKHRLSEFLDPEIKRWSNGKQGNLRALLSTLQYILGADSGWQPVPLTDLITAAAVKKAYRKATLCVHPDKLQQRGATIRQKYICEKVFDLLKDAWNKFTSEER